MVDSGRGSVHVTIPETQFLSSCIWKASRRHVITCYLKGCKFSHPGLNLHSFGAKQAVSITSFLGSTGKKHKIITSPLKTQHPAEIWFTMGNCCCCCDDCGDVSWLLSLITTLCWTRCKVNRRIKSFCNHWTAWSYGLFENLSWLQFDKGSTIGLKYSALFEWLCAFRVDWWDSVWPVSFDV